MLALALATPGCRDDAGDPGASGDPTDGDPTDGDPTDGGSGGDDGPVGEPAAAPAVLHRLTEQQINNSLRALFFAPSLSGITLPPEFEVHGFGNNARVRSPSPYLVESLQRDFRAVTAELMSAPGPWLPCGADGGSDPTVCGHATLDELGSRIFRRPLDDAERQWIQGAFDGWLAEAGFSAAIELSLQALLQSPEFIYRIERGDPTQATGPVIPLTDWEIAARLSLLLWNSVPDDELRQLASEGRLHERAVVRDQARRMLVDPRSRGPLLEFHRQWLDADEIDNLIIDDGTYFQGQEDEEGDSRLYRVSLEYEFERFVLGTLFGPGTYEALMTSREGWVSDQSAPFYGVTPQGAGEVVSGIIPGIDRDPYTMNLYPVTFPADQRAGFLTSNTFLATHAHPVYPSPVLRGVFVLERLLCLPTPVPPDDVPSIEDGETAEPRTNRDRYEVHSTNPACIGCHQAIDGIGFPFEHYDSLGRYRTEDNGYPVDASGELIGTDVDGPVASGVDLAERLAISRTAHDCMVTQWYRYAMHRDEQPEDDQTLQQLRDEFWEDGGVIPNLLVDLVSSPAFLTLVEPNQ
ncbi:MAG: DUF1588 domain-containing protein [Myxococcota bacterium]